MSSRKSPISPKESHMSVQKRAQYLCKREYSPQMIPTSPQKIPVSPQKRPSSPLKKNFSANEPMSPQNSPISPQKSPRSPQESAGYQPNVQACIHMLFVDICVSIYAHVSTWAYSCVWRRIVLAYSVNVFVCTLKLWCVCIYIFMYIYVCIYTYI